MGRDMVCPAMLDEVKPFNSQVKKIILVLLQLSYETWFNPSHTDQQNYLKIQPDHNQM